MDFVAKEAPPERRASLLFSPLDFDRLFLDDDIKKISDNLKDIDSRTIAKRSGQQWTPKRGGSFGVLNRPHSNLPSTPNYKRRQNQPQPSSNTPSRPQQPRKRRGGKSQ